MSFLNPAQEWEEFQQRDPLMANMVASAPRSLFMPPPGVDGRATYVRVLAACVSIWMHGAVIGAALGSVS